ncbi:hypothetical protein ACFQO4_15645 [Saliphagus sp. GCM10025334]
MATQRSTRPASTVTVMEVDTGDDEVTCTLETASHGGGLILEADAVAITTDPPTARELMDVES